MDRVTQSNPIESSPSEPVLAIDEVNRDPSAFESISDFRIDLPKSSREYNGHLLEIAGWVVGRHSSVETLIIRHKFSAIASIPVSVPRPDVPAAFPGLDYPNLCGFNTVLSLTGLPRKFHLTLAAITRTEQTITLGHIIGRRAPIPPPDNYGLLPLLVTSLGRSGSSWLMHLLLQHPDITAYRRLPYELRGSPYWLQTFRTLVEHPHGLDQPSALTVESGSWWGGSNPFGSAALRAWFGNDYVVHVADFCRDSIQRFYKKIADIQDQPSARYFAEKIAPSQAELLRELFPAAHEIILVRDFRDMVASILAFNRKRGYKAFGQVLATTDEAYPFVLQKSVMTLVDAARQNPNALVVKYEDLVTKPAITLATILAHLGTPHDTAAVEEIVRKAKVTTPEMEQYQTSSSVDESVGRWRSEMPESLVAACREAFEEALVEFNYV